MNSAAFDTQFNRLTGHFHLPADASRETLALDWFKAVEHYHVDALEHAVTELIRTSQDRFWPALGKVLTLIQSKFDKYRRTDGKCQTCHGSSWIDVAPFKSNGMIYENAMVRCPDCGIPQPTYQGSGRREELSVQEYRDWTNGDAPNQYMPEGLQGKPWDDTARAEHKAAMMQAFDALRIKLFGKTDEAA